MSTESLDKTEHDLGGRLAAGVVVVALWTAFGLLSSAHFYFRSTASSAESFGDLADYVVVFYWAWALLTPVVLRLARYLSGASPRGWRTWAVVAVAVPAMIGAHGVVYLAALRIAGFEPALVPDGRHLREYALRHGGGDVATIAVLVGAYLFVQATRRARSRELDAAALEARLARADLEVLRWQLQPHFLFNALNTVSTLVLKSETRQAERAITLIARYLRLALEHRADAMLTVADELGIVQQYVQIEALRFGDRLRVETNASSDALAGRIPGLIVQPLVENAIRHGYVRAGGPGSIGIAATVANQRLRLSVSDPGGASVSPLRGVDGFGLRYVRERLYQFYGDDAHFDLAVANAGTVATLDLPYSANGAAVKGTA